MIALLALLACSPDPTPVAVQACEAVPTISVFPDDVALFEPLLVPDEIEILRHAEATRGLMGVKSAGMQQLREAASCAVTSVQKGDEPGTWQVELTRTLPHVRLDGTLGTEQTQQLSWTVVKTDAGLRVRTDLQRMVDMRAEVAEANARDDHERVLELWKSILALYQDPTLVYDIGDATLQVEYAAYRERYIRSDVPADEVERDEETGELVVPLRNEGDRTVSRALLEVVFVVDGEEMIVDAPGGPWPAGQEGEFRVAVPAEEAVLDRMRIRKVELAPQQP